MGVMGRTGEVSCMGNNCMRLDVMKGRDVRQGILRGDVKLNWVEMFKSCDVSLG